jgi:galacturan 1,4-alpha-galacturonidase
MMKLSLAVALLSLALSATAQDACILANAGTGDDAPALLAAVASCAKVTVPAETTLNISSRLDMTGLQDVHIVGTHSSPLVVQS